MQVSLTAVDEESFTGPASAAVNTAPPPGCQVRQEEPKCLKGGSCRKHGVVCVVREVCGDIATPDVGR
eukprot:15451409-Alexandrium_andersonii.AAC.1